MAKPYTIAWITALALERAAARSMLDEEIEEEFQNAEGDDHTYAFGRIGKHYIVIVTLPAGEYGPVSAASAVQALRTSFPDVRFALMVGIGGSLSKEVALGDVVVSEPNRSNGGVVLIGSIKAKEKHERYGFLNSPPQVLRNALTKLKDQHEFDDPQIPTLIEAAMKTPKFRKAYQRPEEGETTVHYGTIASGTVLVKSEKSRREMLAWLADDNIHPLCVEMEAAGIMNSFPCLVIRGISDLADERKNDVWQRYAAIAAAAYTKEFLGCVDPIAVGRAKKLEEVVQKVDEIHEKVEAMHLRQQQQEDDRERKEILEWICPVDYLLMLDDQRKVVHPGSGQWFLQHDTYQQWKVNGGMLVCPGDPGTGKTVLSTIVFDDLSEEAVKVYLPCRHDRQIQQDLDHFQRSLLRSTLQIRSKIPDTVRQAYQARKLDVRTLLFEHIAGVSIVMDALDECKLAEQQSLALLLKELTAMGAQVILMMRPHIKSMFEDVHTLRVRSSQGDIISYCSQELRRLDIIRDDAAFISDIADIVAEVADERFLLAKLHIDSLAVQTSRRTIRDTAKSLPRAFATESTVYDPAYKITMERIFAQPQGHTEIAIQVFSWILVAQEPLSPKVLEEALAVIEGDKELDMENVRPIAQLLSYCGGLLVHDTASRTVSYVHEITKDYLERTQAIWIPRAETDVLNTCLSYLSFGGAQQNMIHPVYELSLQSYTQRHWITHARKMQPTSGIELSPRLLRFVLEQPELDNLMRMALRSPYYERMTFRYPYYERRMSDCKIVHLFAGGGLDHCLLYLLSIPYKGCDHAIGSNAKAISVGDQVANQVLAEEVLLDSRIGCVHCMFNDNQTALDLAASEGHESTVRLLLKHSEVRVADPGGRKPNAFHAAAMGNFVDILQVLLEHDKDSAKCQDDRGKTPMHIAAGYGRYESVQLLLEHDMDGASRQDDEQRTPMHLAAGNGYDDIVQLLLKHDEDGASRQNKSGWTPMHIAACSGHDKVVKLLLEHHKDGAQRDHDGRTPMHLAAMSGHNNVVQSLLEHDKCAATCLDSRGRTPLYYPVMHGRSDVMQLLMEYDTSGASHKDRYGNTIMHIAAAEGRTHIVEQLLGKVDVNCRDVRGRTALHHAVLGSRYPHRIHGVSGVIHLLLNTEGVDVDPVDREGQSPLLLLLKRAVKGWDESYDRKRGHIASAFLATGKVQIDMLSDMHKQRLEDYLALTGKRDEESEISEGSTEPWVLEDDADDDAWVSDGSNTVEEEQADDSTSTCTNEGEEAEDSVCADMNDGTKANDSVSAHMEEGEQAEDWGAA